MDRTACAERPQLRLNRFRPAPLVRRKCQRVEHAGARLRHHGLGQHGEQTNEIDRGADDRGGARSIGLDELPRLDVGEIHVAGRPDGPQFRHCLPERHGVEMALICRDSFGELGDERGLARSGHAAIRHARLESRRREFQDAVDEVAEDVGEVLVDGTGEQLPGESSRRPTPARWRSGSSASSRPAGARARRSMNTPRR